jgi:retinoblastoma-like protein 1
VHDGIIAEVKSIREHWWKPHIKKFFEKKVAHSIVSFLCSLLLNFVLLSQQLLRGDEGTLSGILEAANFELNTKNIRKDYESYVLSIGEYDERIFLGDDANEEIGTPTKMTGCSSSTSDSELGEKMHARRNLATQFDGSNLIPTTPLSGKHYLRAKEQLKITPVATATYLVSRLNALLGRREPEPSPRLVELFEACDKNPADVIEQRVKRMGDTFCQHYITGTDRHDSFAKMRLKMGVILYYKLLEGILYSEKNKRKPLENLLEQNLFHEVLFACCLEIVIFSYNSQRTFPWILETFKLEPIHFYKVIEVIIRTEESLARDVVKHLQRIEEQILESRAWKSDSPLWDALARDPMGVPSCEEASLPGGASVLEPHCEVLPGQSPVSHHKRAFVVKCK